MSHVPFFINLISSLNHFSAASEACESVFVIVRLDVQKFFSPSRLSTKTVPGVCNHNMTHFKKSSQ